MDTLHTLTRSWWSWILNCWWLRRDVAALCVANETATDKLHLARVELEELKRKYEDHLKQHEIAKDGNRALLRFIATSHRLNMKFDPESIRAALERSKTK